MGEQDWQAKTLSYYASRHCSAQWHDFIGVFMQELLGSAGEDDASAFMRHIGEALALKNPLEDAETVEDLEASINVCLDRLDWGWCRLRAGENGIRIIHGAWPMISLPEARWPQMLAAVLEGAYGAWLRQQGGGAVPVRCQQVEAGRPMEFIYGT